MVIQYINNTVIYLSSLRSNFLNFNYSYKNYYIILYESPITFIEAIIVFWIIKRMGDIYFWWKDLEKDLEDSKNED